MTPSSNGTRQFPLVLLVENDADMRFYLSESLKTEYTVVQGETTQIAWAIMMEQMPHVIISGILQAEPRSLEFCKKVKSDGRTHDIPFIVTGPACLETKMKYLELGADEYLSRPIFLNELHIRARNFIHIRERALKKFQRSFTVTAATSLDEKFIEKALAILDMRLTDSQFGVIPLALEMGISPITLYRRIVSITGTAPNQFIRNYRLDRSAALLGTKSGNVSDIAYQVGFNSLSYFSKCFRERFGYTPVEFLKQAG